MKNSKGMQLGAMLAAMLLVSTFAAAVSAQGANEQTKVEKHGKIMTPDGRYILNESDFDKAVIKSGTVKLPNTSSVAERVNATKNVMNQLSITLKVSDDEALDTLCNYSTNECTYRVSKHVKVSAGSAIPTFTGWAEQAKYHNSDGGSTTLFEGIWNVPSAPLDQGAQTIFYFTALGNGVDILQPVLEWGQAGRNYWDIASWYGLGGNYNSGQYYRVNVGDSIYGYVQLQTGQPTHWFIWTYDINTGVASSIYAYITHTFDWNYVALETYNVNNCNQFSGGNDFTNLRLAGRTPSWTAEINQTAKATCGTLGVDIISPSEVILRTGRMP